MAPEILRSERYNISCGRQSTLNYSLLQICLYFFILNYILYKDIWSLGVIMYILCCGYPPFYSVHDKQLSPGMKKRIRLGEFTFPKAEWANVSDDAKTLISAMLEITPEKRLNINEVIKSKWISVSYTFNAKKLFTVYLYKNF